MDLFKTMLLVGTGGFLGSVLRFLVYYFVERTWEGAFPWGTFVVNIVGSFLIGILFGFWSKEMLSESGNRLWITGFCGGFTTFSTFSQDGLRLLQQGHGLALGIYIVGSILLGLAAAYAGAVLVKTV